MRRWREEGRKTAVQWWECGLRRSPRRDAWCWRRRGKCSCACRKNSLVGDTSPQRMWDIQRPQTSVPGEAAAFRDDPFED